MGGGQQRPIRCDQRSSAIKPACAPLQQQSVIVSLLLPVAVLPSLNYFGRNTGLNSPILPEASSHQLHNISVFFCFRFWTELTSGNMRLIQNMTTIAEYPAAEYPVPSRAIKIAVIGGGGVGKTGKKVNENHAP